MHARCVSNYDRNASSRLAEEGGAGRGSITRLTRVTGDCVTSDDASDVEKRKRERK